MSDRYVYRIYDTDGSLLYVGQSVDVAARLRGHRWLKDHPGHSVRIDGPFAPILAEVHERRAIITERPRRNRTWATVGKPTLVTDADVPAITAARYLVGSAESRIESYCEQIVEGYGIEPVAPAGPRRCAQLRYKLIDVEAKYLELYAGMRP